MLLVPAGRRTVRIHLRRLRQHLLAYGADIHIVELRGHGLSNQQLQIDADCIRGPRLELEHDSYFLYDVPAAVAAVKKATGRSRIFYLGNSMGGMLGYGYAGSHDDLAARRHRAPSDIGRGFLGLRAAALFGPVLMGPCLRRRLPRASVAGRTRTTPPRCCAGPVPRPRCQSARRSGRVFKPIHFNHVGGRVPARARPRATESNCGATS